jgi:phospholipase/lecithinase/hemolysin
MQSRKAKILIRFSVGILLFGLAVIPTQAAFTSLYIFGDGVCTTTNNSAPFPYSTNFYGKRFSNGRVWVEVLAQRQGLGANSITNVNWSNSSNNWSYYGQYSSNVVATLTNFPVRPDANTSLFVVWANDADFVSYMGSIYPSTNIVTWTNAMNQSLSNHWKIITNLFYAKNARTLITPNAVDITEIPNYVTYPAAKKSFIRQRVIDYNTAFTALLNQARTSLPGITIYEPDVFSLLDNVLTNAAAYGLTNTLANYGNGVIGSIDAVDAVNYGFPSASINGYGTNYIFWDPFDPTAKLHAVLADVAQQLISPVRISQLKPVEDENQLNVANMPIGLNGFVDGCTNLVLPNWVTQANFISTNATQAVFVPVSGPLWFYRLRFPYAWSWP